MTATASSQSGTGSFTTVQGDRRAEAPRTLAEPVPQALSFVDQLGLWGNLGVSLLGFTGALFVLQPNGAGTPELSLAAAFTALVTGTLLGTLGVAVSGIPGTRTGAPAMVLLRGLFGAGLSYLPTVINMLQLLGWGVFELVTIATAAHTIAPALPRWAYVLIAGVITGVLTVRPLGWIRVLRRYATAAVLVVMVYLLVQLARHPLPPLTRGTWSGFWAATDTVVAVAISFAPMAADYMRHSRSERGAFAGAMIGYSVTQVLCYVIGLLALVTVARNPNDIYGAFIALPLGTAGFAILAARELDQSFADLYSTAVSTQNLRPLWDRRILAVLITGLATALALFLNIADYENFLTLLGSVFVPMFAVLAVDFFVLSQGRWNLSQDAPSRWLMLLPWVVGFVTYQLINPGYLSWWVSAWTWVRHLIGFSPASWMSASICSFVVAAAITLLGVPLRALGRRET
ncbi:MAG TPA: cytosine permease [Streptosporangiaceae bacterium]